MIGGDPAHRTTSDGLERRTKRCESEADFKNGDRLARKLASQAPSRKRFRARRGSERVKVALNGAITIPH